MGKFKNRVMGTQKSVKKKKKKKSSKDLGTKTSNVGIAICVLGKSFRSLTSRRRSSSIYHGMDIYG